MKDKKHPRWCSKHQSVHGEDTNYKTCRFPNKEPKFKPVNVYKPGTKKYYRDVLSLIAIYAELKDEPNKNKLIDMLGQLAIDGLNHEKMYYELEEK